jgi:hypothetical protein
LGSYYELIFVLRIVAIKKIVMLDRDSADLSNRTNFNNDWRSKTRFLLEDSVVYPKRGDFPKKGLFCIKTGNFPENRVFY